MPRRRTAGGVMSSFSLQEAINTNETCDVFVSHKKEDEPLAMEVHDCILNYGLKPWIDVLDPSIHGDGPTLDEHIRGVIASSFSLLAVVSGVTQQSWWVPFEIGIAFDQSCMLETFVEPLSNESELPTFLAKHPRLKRHEPDLHHWCDDIKRTKARLQRDELLTESQGRIIKAAAFRSTYLDEMRRMTSTYR